MQGLARASYPVAALAVNHRNPSLADAEASWQNGATPRQGEDGEMIVPTGEQATAPPSRKLRLVHAARMARRGASQKGGR
jgi:hypothetical protein